MDPARSYAVADPIAIWGAVTGTAALSLNVWRELRGTKRSLRVEHGWQYVRNEHSQLLDVWVCVMVWNTGRRPIHIEHAGFVTLFEGPRELADEFGYELGPENRMWVEQRFEIALNGETIEAIPDGPAVKIWTRLPPITLYGIDPFEQDVRAFVVTVPERYWFGPTVPLVRTPLPGLTKHETGAAVLQLHAAESESRKAAGLPRTHPLGDVIGLQRLILEGDVQYAKTVLDEQSRGGERPPEVDAS